MASSVARRAVGMAILRVLSVTFFCTFLLNPHCDLEPDFIIRKQMKHRFQRYIVHMEMFSIFHTRFKYISRQTIRHSAHSNEKGANAVKCQKPCQKQPLPLETRRPHLIHQCWAHPTHHPKRHLDPISRFATIHSQTDTQTHTDGLDDRSIT